MCSPNSPSPVVWKGRTFYFLARAEDFFEVFPLADILCVELLSPFAGFMPISFSPASTAPCTAPAAAPLIILPRDFFAFLTIPDEATFFALFFTVFAAFDADFDDFRTDFFFRAMCYLLYLRSRLIIPPTPVAMVPILTRTISKL